MTTVTLLSGGAAQGLVRSLADTFARQTGCGIGGDFGAVGLMADRLRSGLAADLVILTRALVTTLADEGLVERTTIADVGRVETALAVRTGDPELKAQTASELRDVFLHADAIYVPDTRASTAGLHVAAVLDRLGITDAVASRLRVHPNGATAMRELAASTALRPVGCTQVTEIVATAGITLSGVLPPGHDLTTTYSAAVTRAAAHPAEARRLIELLTAGAQGDLRRRAGFAA